MTRWTFRTQLVLTVLVAVVPLLVYALSVIVLLQREERATVEQGLRETARALASAVDREVAVTLTATEILATAASLRRGDLEGFYEQAVAAQARNPRWRSVFVVDASGQEVMSLLRPFGTRLPNIGQDADVAEVLRTRRPYVSGLRTGQVSRRSVIRVLVPVMRGQELLYVVATSLGPEAFGTILAQQQTVGPGVATVLDQHGVIVARSRDPDPWVGHRAPPAFLALLAGAQGVYESVTLEGTAIYGGYARAPESGFVATVDVPVAAATAPAQRSLWLLVLGGAVAIAGALGLATLLGRRLSRPVTALAGAVTALGEARALPALPRMAARELTGVQQALERAAHAIEARKAAEAASHAKDQFLAMLAHELRNPLGAITTAVAVLERAAPTSAAAVQARGVIARQASHLTALIADLLDVARVTSGKIALHRRPLDLADAVRRCVKTLQQSGRTAAHHVEIRSADPVWVHGDETRIDQILTNLVENAVKYTPPGGRILVTVAARDQEAIVEVADRGVGIAPDLLPRVFDVFSQGDHTLARSQGGLGLGLALVRRLVDLHGGSVSATSEGPGRGATFTVRLPRLEGGVEAVATAPAPLSPRPRRVLVVEDHVDGRAALTALLALHGHQVHEAHDGPSGLAAASAVAPDVAIIDIGLPGLDGYEVARRLRATRDGHAIRLIALTGYGQEDDVRRARDAGFDAHLVKPVTPEQLDAALDDAPASRGGPTPAAAR